MLAPKGSFLSITEPKGQRLTGNEVMLQGEAKKAKAAQAEAAKKEIAELMAKAKADMDKADKKGEAKAAQSQADEIQKEVPLSSNLAVDVSVGTAKMLGLCTSNSMLLNAIVQSIGHGNQCSTNHQCGQTLVH